MFGNYEKGEEIPGTTPLVAIALIDIAVNIVYEETERKILVKFVLFLPYSVRQPI